MMENKTLARKLFRSLIKGYYISEYIILNDGNFYARIQAANDQEALEIFNSGEYETW